MNKKTFSTSEAISFGWNTFKSNWKFWIISFFIFTVASGSMGAMNFGNLRNSKSSSRENTYLENPNTRDLDFNGVGYRYNEESPLIEKVTARVLGISSVVNNTDAGAKVSSKDSLKLDTIWWFLIPFGFIAFAGFLAAGIIGFLITLVFRMGYLNLNIDAARKKDLYYKTLLNQVSMRKAWRYLNAQFSVSFMVIIGLILFIIPGIILALKYSLVPFIVVDLDKTPSEAMKMSRKLTKNVKFKLLGFWFVCGLVMMLGLLAFGFGVIPASIVVSLAYAYVYNKLLEQSEPAVVPDSSVIPTAPAIEVPLPSSNEAPSVNSGNLLAENQTSDDSVSIKTEN